MYLKTSKSYKLEISVLVDEMSSCQPIIPEVLVKLSEAIDKSDSRTSEADSRERFALEWKQVSLVLDRFLLLIFFLSMTVASLVILTGSPHLLTDSVDNWARKEDENKTVTIDERDACGMAN